MPKNRRRKRKKQSSLRHSTAAQIGPFENRPRRVVKILWAAFGVVAAVSSASYGIYQSYLDTLPNIQLPDPDTTSPFLLPFGIKNDSLFFRMYEVRWTCFIDEVIFKTGGRILRVQAHRGEMPRIGRREMVNYRCPLSIPAQMIKSARIRIAIDYQTLSWQRQYMSAPYTWISGSNPPRWIEGEIVP